MTSRSEDWKHPLSTEEAKGAKRKGGAYAPPARFCHCCTGTDNSSHYTICAPCKEDMCRLSWVIAEVKRCYPETANLTTTQIVRRLWEFRWARRRES